MSAKRIANELAPAKEKGLSNRALNFKKGHGGKKTLVVSRPEQGLDEADPAAAPVEEDDLENLFTDDDGYDLFGDYSDPSMGAMPGKPKVPEGVKSSKVLRG